MRRDADNINKLHRVPDATLALYNSMVEYGVSKHLHHGLVDYIVERAVNHHESATGAECECDGFVSEAT